MADSKAAAKVAETTSDDDAAAAQQVDGLAATEGDAAPKMKAYQSDRNLAEVNANTTFWLDPSSEVGKRLIATGYLTEVDDPQK